MLDPTDSFFFEVPREMLECKHYITPIYNYIDWLDKPAFPFLLIALSYKCLGLNDFAARLPSALSGIIMILLTYIFALKRINRRTALLSSLILCSSLLFLIVGHVALSDEPLSMLFTAAMLISGCGLAGNRSVNLSAYIFLALAILCKGPIAVILAGGSIALYLLVINRTFSEFVSSLFKLKLVHGIFIVLLICVPYYCLAHATTNGAFSEQFFFRQNLGRLQGKVNHLEPIWFYLPVFFGGYFPWSVYFILSISWLRGYWKRRFSLTHRQKFILFCLCWFLFVAVLFTLVPTRLATYIVPFSSAFSIIVGAFFDLLIRVQQCHQKCEKVPFKVALVLPPALIAIASTIAVIIVFIKLIDKSLFLFFGIGQFLVLTGSFLAVKEFWQNSYRRAIFSLTLALTLSLLILIPASFVWFYRTHQLFFNQTIALTQKNKANIATLFSPVPSVVFYLGHRIPNIENLDQLGQFSCSGQKPHYLLASRNCLDIPELQAKEHIIETDGKWYLLDVDGFPWQ